MIPAEKPIEPGAIVRHDDGGLLYQVEDLRLSTTGYETTHTLGRATVNYVQLEDGSYPVGTKWNKDEADFRANFTIKEN